VNRSTTQPTEEDVILDQPNLNDRHLTQRKPQRLSHSDPLRQARLLLERLNRIQRPLLILAIGLPPKGPSESAAPPKALQNHSTPQTSTQANPQDHAYRAIAKSNPPQSQSWE
jgi:hypothetical protein